MGCCCRTRSTYLVPQHFIEQKKSLFRSRSSAEFLFLDPIRAAAYCRNSVAAILAQPCRFR